MFRLFKKNAKKDSSCCNVQIEEIKEKEIQTSEATAKSEDCCSSDDEKKNCC